MKKMPVNTMVPGKSSFVNESSSLPATNVENYHPQKVGLSTTATDTLSLVSRGLFNAVYFTNTNAVEVTISIREFVPVTPNPSDPDSEVDDGTGDILWGPVTFDLTGITTLEEFMTGGKKVSTQVNLWATLCEKYASGTQDFIPADDWVPQPGDIIYDHVEYAGSYSPPLNVSGQPRLIIPKSVILMELSTGAGGPAVYCGVVRVCEEIVEPDPLRGLTETYDSKSNVEELNSGGVFIQERDNLRKVSGTVLHRKHESKIRFLQMMSEVGPYPIPWQFVSDGTVYWNIFGRYNSPPSVSYGYVDHAETTFEIIEVL